MTAQRVPVMESWFFAKIAGSHSAVEITSNININTARLTVGVMPHSFDKNSANAKNKPEAINQIMLGTAKNVFILS